MFLPISRLPSYDVVIISDKTEDFKITADSLGYSFKFEGDKTMAALFILNKAFDHFNWIKTMDIERNTNFHKTSEVSIYGGIFCFKIFPFSVRLIDKNLKEEHRQDASEIYKKIKKISNLQSFI